jgi:molybdopterin synthase sulfur carrier subunit
MVKVEFLGPIDKADMNLDISNLLQLSEILKNDKDVSSWLESCAVAINDTLVNSKDIELKDGEIKDVIVSNLDTISKKDGNLHKIFNNHYWIRELFENIDPENVTSNFEYSMEKIIKENEIDDNILKQCIINKDIFFFDLNYTPSFI